MHFVVRLDESNSENDNAPAQVKDITTLFSDRFRKTKIIVCAIVILFSCIFAAIEGPKRNMTLRKLLKNPDKYMGQELIFATALRKIQKNLAGEFEFRDQQYKFDIKFTNASEMRKLPPKGYISIRGKVEPDCFRITEFHIHTHREIKVITSLIALLMACIYLWYYLPKIFTVEES